MSQFKNLGCILDGSSTDGAECFKNVPSERKAAGTVAIKSFVNARDLQLKCVGVLHEPLLVTYYLW